MNSYLLVPPGYNKLNADFNSLLLGSSKFLLLIFENSFLIRLVKLNGFSFLILKIRVDINYISLKY